MVVLLVVVVVVGCVVVVVVVVVVGARLVDVLVVPRLEVRMVVDELELELPTAVVLVPDVVCEGCEKVGSWNTDDVPLESIISLFSCRVVPEMVESG
jgi:hypothetical protein